MRLGVNPQKCELKLMGDLPHEGLLFWLKADSLQYENDEPISEWVPSLGGTFGYATQDDVSVRPQYRDDAIGTSNNPGVYFGGPTISMKMQKGLTIKKNDTRTLFFVFTHEKAGNVFSVTNGSSLGITEGGDLRIYNADTKLEAVTTGHPKSNGHVYTIIGGNNFTHAFIDSNKVALGGSEKALSVHWDLNNTLFFGGGSSGGGFTGLLGEVIVYEGVVKQEDRKKVEKYLAYRWDVGSLAEVKRKKIQQEQARNKNKNLPKTAPSSTERQRVQPDRTERASPKATRTASYVRPHTTTAASRASLKTSTSLPLFFGPLAPRMVFGKAERFSGVGQAVASAELGGEMYSEWTATSGSGRFGRDLRFKIDNTPAPGPDFFGSSISKRGIKFGNSSRFNTPEQETPGCELGHPTTNQSPKPKFCVAPRFALDENGFDPPAMPVPPTFSFIPTIRNSASQPHFSIGKSQRFNEKHKNTPGCTFVPTIFHHVPGFKSVNNAVSFGVSSRFDESDRAKTPAATYNPPSFWGSGSPKVSMGVQARFVDIGAENRATPGPSFIPGDKLVVSRMRSQGNVRFGKSPRFPTSANEMKSPEFAYSPPSFSPVSGKTDKNKATKFSVSDRFIVLPDNIPGPEYTIEASEKLVKPKKTAAVMGKAGRFESVPSVNANGPDFNPPTFAENGTGRPNTNKAIGWGAPPKKPKEIKPEGGADFVIPAAVVNGGKFGKAERFEVQKKELSVKKKEDDEK